MTRIILTRHGETLWNVEKKVQGNLDSSLTEKGRDQARSLALRLSKEKISAIYASDLKRAQSTAAVIAEALGVDKVQYDSALREMNFGEWEGEKWEELRQKNQQVFACWDNEPYYVKIPGGEMMENVLERAWNFILRVIEQHPEETVCIVSHGITVQLMMTKVLGYELNQLFQVPWQLNTAVNIFNVSQGMYEAEVLADCSHLND